MTLHVGENFNTENNFPDPTLALKNYQQFLASNYSDGQLGAVRGPGSLTATGVCMNYLLSHVDYAGYTIGVLTNKLVFVYLYLGLVVLCVFHLSCMSVLCLVSKL